MRLLCGSQEITPIRPGKVQLVGGESASASINDTSYMGLYDYLPDAISPACSQVTLEIYADKNSPPTVKPLDQDTIHAVWNDFEPYRKSRDAQAAAVPAAAAPSAAATPPPPAPKN